MNEYYRFLGVDENATDEEIEARYNELKKKFEEDRWLDGEAGNEGAQNLTKLETAYTEIKTARLQKEREETGGSAALEEVAALLKENKINEAQAKLDAFNERNAEWHYLQACIFYKKNWTNESKKQLEIAIELDGDNKKYREAYGKLNAKNDYEKRSAKNERESEPAYDDRQMGGNACSQCISCCYTYLCVDCLFSLCCGCR
ncbi:MAG: hypothetical protein ACI4SH_08370 [Candidatus Scatosoma sp.]